MTLSTTAAQVRFHRVLHVALLFVVSLVTALPLQADTILIQAPEVVVQRAPLIVEAVVTDIRYAARSDLPMGEAWITLQIVEHIAGNSRAEIVDLGTNALLLPSWQPTLLPSPHRYKGGV